MGQNDEQFKKCYNAGCPDKEFLESQNGETSCRYHPNMPIFHDGIKRWPCCKKSSCDFSTLLSYPGCVSGPHNPNKPEPVAPPPAEEPSQMETILDKLVNAQPELTTPAAPQGEPEIVRDPNEPMVSLQPIITQSLKTALEKMWSSIPPVAVKPDLPIDVSLSEMMQCENFGCSTHRLKSEIEKNNLELIEDCLHHPKPPIFHEGLQYWGCCQKKHTDFEKMRNQPGCSYGKHKWVKGVTKTKCRYDHFDSQKVLTLNIYAKNADPDRCSFELNSCRLKVTLVYGVEKLSFDKEFNLFSTVDASKCTVTMNATKIEVKLVKNPQCSWKAVEVLPD